ncbi:response regulator transcription factor [[Clostridium] dakarense]|uniref:response regulator transcription factor n=1 Tax=Faecalimicrobium dakarense TaxID=1301100 RepID=UPI0004B41A7E|nr:response regulator transcription factor [[Clostridium] dakarense]
MVRVLMVEDDNTIAFGVKYALEQEGFNVDISKDLESGRENLNNNEYSIILLDVTLPDGTGYELCKEIRSTSEVPIIFLTACDEEVNIVMGLDIGGDDYMTKPFRVRELISRIKAVLRRKSGYSKENKKILKFGDLSIHTLEARVYKNNEEIFLTSVEYKLLLILIQNKNTVLSRTQILEKLWDVTYDFVNDNTLTVYIKRLREKVEDDSSTPKKIITVRGLGYKWVGCENDVNI